MPGVTDAVCVYVGGVIPNPTYGRILDYTEGVTVTWDPDAIAFVDLLAVFMGNASLTTPCSGARQYMTGVWFHTDEQRTICEMMFRKYEERHGVKIKVHTDRVGLIYRAEEYHQRYFEKNGSYW